MLDLERQLTAAGCPCSAPAAYIVSLSRTRLACAPARRMRFPRLNRGSRKELLERPAHHVRIVVKACEDARFLSKYSPKGGGGSGRRQTNRYLVLVGNLIYI